MNSKGSPKVSPLHGSSRISTTGLSLLNGNDQTIYRRSPLPNIIDQSQSDLIGNSYEATSYNSEGVSDTNNSIDCENLQGLSEKYEFLQRQIEILNINQTKQDERYKRSRQENDFLLSKVHSLEDQLRELELDSEARAKEDEKRFKETMAKQMQVKTQECEQHLHANYLLQQDLFALKNDLINSEALVKALRSEKSALDAELQEKNQELSKLDEEIHKLKLLVKNLKDEESVKSNLINILNEELEVSHSRSHRESQHINQSCTSSSHDHDTAERFSSSRRSSVTSGFGDEFLQPSLANKKALKDIDGLEMSLVKLREENKKLKETNEELQADLLNMQLETGRSLVQEGNKSYSLADEMGDIDVQAVMKALKEQQDDNARLRKYLDEILLKIVERNPEILEKTSNEKESQSSQRK